MPIWSKPGEIIEVYWDGSKLEIMDHSTEEVIPYNLKTGATNTHRAEPTLNGAYRELADYYRIVIVSSQT